MSESSAFPFGKFIPGFDFLQQLAPGGQAASGLTAWVAPTVSIDELDKRIQELKTVLFWLEQNGTALKATIQALEVQKMTLATLASMNLSMAEIAKAFTLPTQSEPAAPSPAAGATPEHWPFTAAPAPQAEPAAAAPEPAAALAPATAAQADPMQWWDALTQQFQQIAANAMRDAAQPAATAADASDSVASSVEGAGSEGQKGSQKKAATKRPAKKAAKKASAPAARKAPAKKAAAKKTAARKKPATKSAPAKPTATAASWPLPPPFKFGR
ncbi:MAG: hypothetical protein Q4G70_00465 [Pseudomonadota bacterium]|nr:hypothetical protein [Pseudomonadota bacterium]